jgi:hypothetical protein
MRGFRRSQRSSIEDVPSDCGGQKEKGGNGGRERSGTHVPFGRHRLRLIGWHRRRQRFRLHRLADFERVEADGLSDVLQLSCAEVGDLEIEPTLDLSLGILGQADRSGFGDAFQPRRDIHAVAHQVAVSLLHHVAEMDADSKLDPPVGRDLGVALDHRPLDLDSAVHRIDDAAELDDAAVASALDDGP